MHEVIRRAAVLVFVAVAPVLGAACGRQSTTTPGGSSATGSETYVPGLGEMMSLQQMRHVKLWFAGQAGNWELAAYEIEELGEGFDDVVKFHPTHKDSPVAPKDAIPRMVTEPLQELRVAVGKKDAGAFVQAYDALTASCNNCHQATNFGFNRVQTPSMNPYPNQVFSQ
jgi:hypothetical protein